MSVLPFLDTVFSGGTMAAVIGLGWLLDRRIVVLETHLLGREASK